MPSKRPVLILLALIIVTGLVALDSFIINERILLNPNEYSYQLGNKGLIRFSETVSGDSITYLRNVDYQIDYTRGIIKLIKPLEEAYLHLDYLLIQPKLGEPHFSYRYLAIGDSLVLPPKKSFRFAEDSSLLVSGSKTFALTFSDNSAFDLKQSLFVNLSGELSKGIMISAQLSDSQSKLSPEGDSKELGNLDQVFIKVYNNAFDLSMGDVTWKSPLSRYINYESKIEGIMLSTKGRLSTSAGYSAENGKPAQIDIPVIDGKQGPYFLNSTGFQSSYRIVAGSESIYQNGVLLSRGVDYTIDYSGGSVMFKKLVVSSDRIRTYYQYSDEYFKQSMFFGSAGYKLNDSASINSTLIFQNDDSDNPLMYSYSDADRDSLRLAGDDLAWGNGVIHTLPGQGLYNLAQTPEGIEYYVYAQSDSLAEYSLTFSYVGSGLGDYEEFSSGKYIYRGLGMGSWIIGKRLVAPASRLNANFSIEHRLQRWRFNAEGLLSREDKNTLSSLDDGDNLSGVLYGSADYNTSEPEIVPQASLDLEHKFPGVYRFSDPRDLNADIDLSGITIADSLGQSQLNMSITFLPFSTFRSTLSGRINRISDGTALRAVRYWGTITGKGFVPWITSRNTIAEISGDSAQERLISYHSIRAEIRQRLYKLGIELLLEGNESRAQNTASSPDTRHIKYSPWFDLQLSERSITRMSYIRDIFDTRINTWENSLDSQIYSFRHTSGSQDHNIDLDWTHRLFDKPATGTDNSSKAYDLIKLRSTHTMLKKTVTMNLNYLLNQTEFFPSIRELEYIGQGLGFYDSTGVYTPNGDYDYNYIVSDIGEQSTEINGTLNMSFRPGAQILKGTLKRFQTDVSIVAIEQTNSPDGYLSYLFYPGTVFDAQRTIYGKQNLTHNVWLDMIPGKANLLFSLEFGRSLDKRYQDTSRTFSRIISTKLDLRQIRLVNYSLTASSASENDSRYGSEITRTSLVLNGMKYFSTQSNAEFILSFDEEKGQEAQTSNRYSIVGFGLNPSYKTMLLQKYRISANLGLRYNMRTGSDFLSFLPEKRDGVIGNWSLKSIYKLNSFSTASFEYSGKSYPGERVDHQIKFEFKAEL